MTMPNGSDSDSVDLHGANDSDSMSIALQRMDAEQNQRAEAERQAEAERKAEWVNEKRDKARTECWKIQATNAFAYYQFAV